jgi:hypothetical protein
MTRVPAFVAVIGLTLVGARLCPRPVPDQD